MKAKNFLAGLISILVLATPLVAAPSVDAAVYYSDPWITGRVKMGLMLSADINASNIHVDTVDRVVILHGSVPTAAQSALAEKLAGQVTGVRGVRNLIAVVAVPQHSINSIADDALQRRVQWALSADPWLANSSLSVESVTEGKVVIGGRADSMSDHLRALTLVRNMQGVESVASVVDSPDVLTDEEVLNEEALRERFWERADFDAQTTSRVKLALAAADGIPAPNINVDTRNGVVILFGTVTSEGVRQRVEDSVLTVDGVVRIVNDLEIVPGQPLEKADVGDADLSSRIDQVLRVSGDSLAGVHAAVKDGTVHLSGRVPDQTAKLAAVVRVRTVPGVRSVSEALTLAGDETAPPANPGG